jgi:Chaperone of endosialidase
MTTLHLRNAIGRSPLQRGFLLILLALTWSALSPAVRAQLPSPAPDGGYSGENTAEGDSALFNLAPNGVRNTAIGFNALFSNTGGGANTAIGAAALASNTANDNTACGSYALANNTTGSGNTATGIDALMFNIGGNGNTANGRDALFNNTSGSGNTANGNDALFNNTTGTNNTANGLNALVSNTTGINNTANGLNALLHNTSGSGNIALGASAGNTITTGSNNIDIGNSGVFGDTNRIRIGKVGTQTATYIAGVHGVTVASAVGVVIDVNGHLGTVTSSARFKEAVKPMERASEAILALRPVTFHYKHELDPESIPQFGLVAEEVEKVNPDLVVRDAEGKVYTVRYDAVNAMLLNEFLKEHRNVTQLETTVAQQQKKFESKIAGQQKEIEALTAGLKEQASQIQKVSAELEFRRPALQTALNNQ